MWRKGGSLLEFGIYGSKDVRRYMGLLPNEEDVINVPRIAFYDEIWVKKSCEDFLTKQYGYRVNINIAILKQSLYTKTLLKDIELIFQHPFYFLLDPEL